MTADGQPVELDARNCFSAPVALPERADDRILHGENRSDTRAVTGHCVKSPCRWGTDCITKRDRHAAISITAYGWRFVVAPDMYEAVRTLPGQARHRITEVGFAKSAVLGSANPIGVW